MSISLLQLAAFVIITAVFAGVIRKYVERDLLVVLVAVVVSSLIFVRSGDALVSLVAYLSVTTALLLYGRRFYISFAPLFAISLYLMVFGKVAVTALAISLGTSISILMSGKMIRSIGNNEKEKGNSVSTEIIRDVFQIGTGVVTMIIMEIFALRTAEAVVITGMLLLYLAGNIATENRDSVISRILHSMERDHVDLGIGSIMLAIGALFLFGLITDRNVVLIGIFLLLIADPVATITGRKFGKAHLPYNRKKTVTGFGSALLVSVVFASVALGPYYAIYAVIGTFIESATRSPLDDNLTVPLSVVVLNLVLNFF